MPQQVEEKQEDLNLEKYWDLVRRRIWYFIVPLFLGWAGVWGASWGMKSVYRSGTLILIEEPTISARYVVPNISDAQNKVQNLTQKILSRTRLLQIIEAQGLYKDSRTTGNDDLVDQMRKDIEIELVRSGGDRGELTAFNIYYSSPDPNTAQRVTSELTNLFITENIENQRRLSGVTTEFLQGRLDEAKASLTAQEDQIRAFKEQHQGDLPGQLQGNIQILSGIQSQMSAEEDALNRVKQQNIFLEAQLTQYKMQHATKSGDKVSMGLPALDDELDRLRNQLAELSMHYTDKHPDVRKLKEQIASTEKLRDKVAADLKAKAAAPPTNDPAPAAADNEIKEVGPMLDMQTQLKVNKMEIVNRERSIQTLKGQVADYQARLNRQPVREQQLVELTRNYDQSRELYDSLLKKKDEAELATKLDDSQNGEHFRIQDPPSLPVKPYSPNRLKLSGIGVAVGLLLGAIFVVGAEVADDRLYDEKALKDILPATVITEIPAMITLREEARERKGVWIERIAALLVFTSILAGTAVSFLAG